MLTASIMLVCAVKLTNPTAIFGASSAHWLGVNKDKHIVGYTVSSGVSTPAYWSSASSSATSLALPSGYSSGRAVGIADDGTIWGTASGPSFPNYEKAVYWDKTTHAVTIITGYAGESHCFGCSQGDSTHVTKGAGDFKAETGGFFSLDNLWDSAYMSTGGGSSVNISQVMDPTSPTAHQTPDHGSDIDNLGNLCGSYDDMVSMNLQAYLYVPGGSCYAINNRNSENCYANAVTTISTTSYVTGTRSSTGHYYLWTPSSFITVPTPSNATSVGYDVSDLEDIVGQFHSNSSGQNRAFITIYNSSFSFNDLNSIVPVPNSTTDLLTLARCVATNSTTRSIVGEALTVDQFDNPLVVPFYAEVTP